MQRMLFAVNHYCVTGIGATLTTQNHIRLTGQIIRNFSFPLIAPLRTYNN